MKLKVLGCSGAEFPGHNTSAFLIDDSILLDAGTVGAVLHENDQLSLTHIFITHTHFDHIKGIPLLADNMTIRQLNRNIKIVSTATNLQAIRQHLLNGVIWPDFSRIPSASPALSYIEIQPGENFHFGSYTVTACPVNHSVPAVGYIIRRAGSSLLYTGDTGPTLEIWEKADNLSAMIIEVSFPDAMQEMALLTKHLTPRLLAKELAKLKRLPPRIFITHLKPQFIDILTEELHRLDIPGLEILTDGAVHHLQD